MGPPPDRLEHDLDPRELAGAARLLLVGVVDLGAPPERLAIGHLRRADVGFHLVGALQDVDLAVEVKLARPAQDGLAALLVGGDPEGRVLGGQLLQSDAQLLLVGFRLRLDGDLNKGPGRRAHRRPIRQPPGRPQLPVWVRLPPFS